MRKIIFALIIIFSIILRFWDLGEVPISPDWDEVALGYNAYSILKTGKDEFGESFPLILRSFDDYKPALYAYLAIPFIALFGLETFAVRLPSAIFGVLTVLAVYFLTKQLFLSKGSKKNSENIALLTMFLMAVSPWHIQFSRIAFEANIAFAFNVFALLFFFKSLQKKWLLLISAVLFSLTFYTYQSAKVFTPLILFLLLSIFIKEFWRKKQIFILSIILFMASSLPFFWATFTTENALLRAKGVSVFSDQTSFLEKNVKRLMHDQETGNQIGLIFDNRRITYLLAFFSGYLSHFDLKWLFLTGDIARHQPPNFGHLYLFELPFFLIGIYQLAFSNLPKKIKLFLFSWFLIVPIPAAITIDIPHAVRTLNFLPLFQIFTALGFLVFVGLIRQVKVKMIKYLFFSAAAAVIFFNLAYYLDQYFVQYNYSSAEFWQYGYKEAIAEVLKIERNYQKIIVSNKAPMDQSYMFFLFFTKYDPQKYLEEGGTKSGGFAEVNSFSKYVFRPIDWNDEEKEQKLFVGRPADFPNEANIIKTIYYPNNEPAIKIAGW